MYLQKLMAVKSYLAKLLKKYLVFLLVFCITFAVVWHNFSEVESTDSYVEIELPKKDIGDISLSYDAAEEFYEAIGYVRCAKDQAKQDQNFWMYLNIVKEKSCEQQFREFAESETEVARWPPPKIIPDELKNNYTLWGRIPVNEYYFAEKFNGKEISPLIWTPEYVDEYVRLAKLNSSKLGYAGDTPAIYMALEDYKLTGQSGLVIGSISPWLEAILLTNGQAKHVTTVEYYPIVSTHPQISYVHPLNLSQHWHEYKEKKFDFMFSFSSIEHSGLGRFGDKLDPNGDLKELRKTACLLPYGALMFLGFETGQDNLRWNAHRVYGQWRLPLVTAGYEVLDVYYREGKVTNVPQFIRFNNESQPVVVLKNLKNRKCD